MNRFRQLVREPALLIEIVSLLVVTLVSFGIGLKGDQQTYIVAAFVALMGLLKAFLTRPFAVAFLTDFIRAALVLAASFGVTLSADQISQFSMLVGLITTVVIRGQITPARDPVIEPGGSGAGPVSGRAPTVPGQVADPNDHMA